MRAIYLALWSCLSLLACGKEANTVQPTQVLVTVHTNLTDELARVEVRLFDVRETRMSDAYEFELTSQLSLPLSFAVVPADDKPADRLLVVVTGKNALGEVLAQNKAIAVFSANEIKAVDLWLLEACRAVTCAAGQTCGANGGVAGQCGATPSLEGHLIKPGEENKEPPVTPMLQGMGEPGEDSGVSPPADDGRDSRLGMEAGTTMLDAGRDAGGPGLPRDAGRDASAVDAGSRVDASPPADSGPVDSGPVDSGPPDPVLPLVPCEKDSTAACSSFRVEWGILSMEPMGALMAPNVGVGYENAVHASDTVAACSTVIQGLGYTKPDADYLANPVTENLATDLRLYTLYRPANWKRGVRYPVVLWANGNCILPELYGGILRYIASQGFIVIAPNARIQTTGAEQLNALRFLTAINQSTTSAYYQRMDITKVATMGQPQASAASGADARVSTAILFGPGNVAKPFFMLGAEGQTLSTFTTALAQATAAAYVFLNSNPNFFDPSLMSMRQPERMTGSITAWLRYRLDNDANGRAMFVGPSCGLCNTTSEYSFGQKALP